MGWRTSTPRWLRNVPSAPFPDTPALILRCRYPSPTKAWRPLLNVRDLISNHLKLKHLRVFLFDETRCRDMVRAICPGHSDAETVFGVNGAYGRHSFLKTVLLIWQLAVNPKVRFTFKIDLDQVFDQKALRSHTGRSALQLLSTPLWGGRAVDHEGRDVDLECWPQLVNECDLQNGCLCLMWRALMQTRQTCPLFPTCLLPPMAAGLSTKPRSCSGAKASSVFMSLRHHGNCDTALRKWQPFTPTASTAPKIGIHFPRSVKMGISPIFTPQLIMRHDKQALPHARSPTPTPARPLAISSD